MPSKMVIALILVGFWSAVGIAQSGDDSLPGGFRELDWVRGPRTVTLFGVASLEIPNRYRFLNPADTEKFNTLTQNPSSGTEYLLAPDDLRWVSYFRFSDDGYVRDNEKIDPDQLLKSIKDATDRGNMERRQRGWPEMLIYGWKLAPFYDSQTKYLEWAINGASKQNGQADSSVINLNTRILGRRGYTSVTLVSGPEGFDRATTEFKDAVEGYRYSSSETYASFRSGDKVAEYGLAALITGGAAAVATKTGLWKSIAALFIAAWKVVVAGVVAAVGFLRNLFRRKPASESQRADVG